jgi:Ser/Thr protein kinase RdoA (MazF antagonist)
VTAKLHKATEGIVIPSNIHSKKWDKVFYYRDEVPVYREDKYQQFVDQEYHEVMDYIIPYLDKKLQNYYITASAQLIHADLNPYNVWTYKDEIRVIDFEEAMYGLPVHDFAISLFYYKYDDKFDYPKVYDLLFEGYKKERKLPEFSERDIELFITARRVNF